MNTWAWIFLIGICSLASAQFAIYETKQTELSLCEEQVEVDKAYANARKACESQVQEYKEYKDGYIKLETALDEWIKECKK